MLDEFENQKDQHSLLYILESILARGKDWLDWKKTQPGFPVANIITEEMDLGYRNNDFVNFIWKNDSWVEKLCAFQESPSEDIYKTIAYIIETYFSEHSDAKMQLSP